LFNLIVVDKEMSIEEDNIFTRKTSNTLDNQFVTIINNNNVEAIDGIILMNNHGPSSIVEVGLHTLTNDVVCLGKPNQIGKKKHKSDNLGCPSYSWAQHYLILLVATTSLFVLAAATTQPLDTLPTGAKDTKG
jgi:hypothetical protein